jgi:hypothetical protein
MHLARGLCDRCQTGMTAFSDETGIPETLNVKCVTCRQGRVLIDVMKDPASNTVVPTMKPLRAPVRMKEAPLPPTAIVHIQPDGDVHYLKTAGVELIVVDERVPEDRSYRITDEGIECQADVERLTDGIVGSKEEPRHAAMAGRIRAMAMGEPVLAVVE